MYEYFLIFDNGIFLVWLLFLVFVNIICFEFKKLIMKIKNGLKFVFV